MLLVKICALLVLLVAFAYAAAEATASHILVPSEALANDLLTQLKAGADFAALARAHSTCLFPLLLRSFVRSFVRVAGMHT